MIYMSPVWHTIKDDYQEEFGYIVSYKQKPPELLERRPWIADNGVFAGQFEVGKWLRMIDKFRPYASTCKGIVIPDVVGDWWGTLRRWEKYAPMVPDLPKAFVTQDGLTLDKIPWGSFKCLFIGGSDDHKLKKAGPYMRAAIERGVWLHVGRVNSVKRMLKFESADSVDGTMLATEPSTARQKYIVGAMRTIQARKENKSLWDM